ncbi:hypothetical protein SNE40_006971 [Patella caerulea]|uniref:Uncharacterized protein n=1 Tax=Patella caerulea TaxID=87958 RepID=A0AAN8JWR7_PATCE
MAVFWISRILVLIYATAFGASCQCLEPNNLHELRRSRRHIPVDNIAEIDIPVQYRHTIYFSFGSVGLHGPAARCTVYSRINFDENRVPKRVPERGCARVHPSRDGEAHGVENCITVSAPQAVYRRTGCRNGIFEYTLTREYFNSGCERLSSRSQHQVDSPKSPENHPSYSGQDMANFPRSPENHPSYSGQNRANLPRSPENHPSYSGQNRANLPRSPENHPSYSGQNRANLPRSPENHPSNNGQDRPNFPRSSENHPSYRGQDMTNLPRSSENHPSYNGQGMANFPRSSENHPSYRGK